MAKDQPILERYEKLTGFGARWSSLLWPFVGNRLFLGEGHIVSVTFSGLPVYQRYHRFYFRDISSISYGSTQRQAIYFIIIALVWIFFLAIIAFVSDPMTFNVSAGLISAVGIALCVWNYVKGERCRFFVSTAVQTFEIPSVSTMARAHRVMERITPLIQDAQKDQAVAPGPGSAASFSEKPSPPDSSWYQGQNPPPSPGAGPGDQYW